MIIGSNVSKSFAGESVFENLDFKIGNNKKVALVGKNGCGKSTLFKVINGNMIADTGSISTDDERIAYIEQEISFPNKLVGEYLEEKLENQWEFYRVDKLVSDLEFTNFDPYQEINSLSEGQKMKLKILESLLNDPSFLLIDEPTNHLDIEGIMWFENYIKNLDKTVIMISHDREFINNTVDEVWELEDGNLRLFVGNYDFYKEEKLRLINKWNDEYKRFLRKKAQLEKMLVLARGAGTSRGGGGVKQVKSRIEREVVRSKKEKYVNQRLKNIRFETGIKHAKLMVKFDDVTKSYGDNNVFQNLDFQIRGGEKIWMFGPNGAGKTTIVKHIMQEAKPSKGAVTIGNDITIGYFAQKQTHLNYDKDVFNYFIEQTGCFHEDAYSKLNQYMFEKKDLKKKIGNLSPGQRARFAFAIFAYNDYDMLVLDEPDNHLDIDTKETLEDSLSNYKGTLFLISHDRFFVERAGIEKVLNLKDGMLREY